MADCCDGVHDEGVPLNHGESEPALYSPKAALKVTKLSNGRSQTSPRAPRRARGKRLGPGFTSLTTRFRVRNYAKKHPSQAGIRKPRDVVPSPFPIIHGAGGLDPFIPLPTALSERDRGLLHFYMTDLPRIWYGMTSNPVFSIARDVALPRGIKSETHLAWMLLAAENMRKHVPEEEKTALIASRRAFNYRKMRLLLEDPQTRHLDSTLAILALAGSAENRLGSVTLARKHLRAVLHLLTEKDGFQSLQSLTGSTGLEIMNALYQVGFPLILNNLTTLENTFDTMATRLRQMYAWNVRMRDTVVQAQILRDEPALVQSGPATDYGYTAIPKGPGYWEALRQTLGPSSIISECLRPTFGNLPETATRCRIGSLYCLNSVLFNLQQDENTAIHFLNDLAYIVSNSYNLTAPDKTEKEIWLQNLHIATALPATIAHCAMRHGQWLDEAWRPPALRTWESLEFVEIVMLMPSSSRHSLLSLMHSWLTSDECGLNHQDVPVELELEEIKKAIMLKWMTNNSIGV